MKILILNGDKLEKKIKVKDRFVFIITKDKEVFHIDSADGNMWKMNAQMVGLGEAHKNLIKKELK